MFHTYKKIGAALIAMLLIAALAACGNSSDTKGSSEKEETITYKAENGNIKIPKHPKRVVVMADGYYGDFKQLGINVVGAPQNVFKNPYYKGKTKGVTNIGDGASVEKIIDLKPDLIVVWTTQGADIEKLEKIAPTIAIKYDKLSNIDQFKEFAKMTGTEDKADKWLAEWDKKTAAAKTKVQKRSAQKPSPSCRQTEKTSMYSVKTSAAAEASFMTNSG